MKPDKHKQKKQNEYKRKHGIQGKSSKHNETLDKSESNKAIGGIEKKSEPQTSCNPHENKITENAKSDVENNWDYSGTVTDEDDDSGEELSDMLRDTANTNFQYQYQRKSLFDDVGDYKNISQKCLDFVSVDFNILSKTLLGIPLYKRLDLQEELFEDGDLRRMKEEAEMEASYEQEGSVEHKPKKVEDGEDPFGLVELASGIVSDTELVMAAEHISLPCDVDESLSLQKPTRDRSVAKCGDISLDPIKQAPLSSIKPQREVQPQDNKRQPTINSQLTKPNSRDRPLKVPTLKELEDELDNLLLL